MFLAFSASGVLAGASSLSGKGIHPPVMQAAGAQPFIEDSGPPPAATDRAERAFELIGIALMLVILVSAILILIRQRR
jgi:hypothetical protein